MGKQRATETIKSLDYLPNVTQVAVPDDVKKVVAARGIDPVAWEAQINSRIAEGGQRKRETLEKVFPTFDKILGGNQYSGMLQIADTDKQNRRAETDIRRAGRDQRAIADILPANAKSIDPNANTTPATETKPVERVGAIQAFFGPLHNAVLAIPEGVADFANELNTSAVRLSAAVPWASKEDKIYAKKFEETYLQRRDSIDKFADFMEIYVDPETSKSPVSFGVDKNGDREVDWSAAKDPKKWLAGVGSGVGSMVPSMLAGGGGASLLMNFFQQFSANQDDAIEAGLKGNEVFAYATGTSAAGSVLELIGQNGFMNSGKGISKDIIREIVKDKSSVALEKLATKGITSEVFDDVLGKTYRESMKDLRNESLIKYYGKIASNFGSKLWKTGAPEAGTEFIQEWENYGAKRLWNGTDPIERQEGDGRFRTDAWETTGNSIFGGLLGGFLGASMGSLHSNPNPKELHETIGAYINADIKAQLAKNPDATLNDIIEGNQFNKVLNAATNNGQFKNPDGTVNVDAINDVIKKSQAIYKTYYDFKDLPNFRAEDKLAMFNITDVRNQNMAKRSDFDQKVAAVSDLESQIDQMKKSGSADPSELTKMQAQKATFENEIGEKNPETGRFIIDEEIEAEDTRMENVFEQAVPEISNADPDRAAMGRSFLNSNIAAFKDPSFKADSELVLPNGMVVVRDNFSTAIRQVNTTAVQPESTIKEQLAKGDYEPIVRYEKSFDPIGDFKSYKAASDGINQGQTRATSDVSRSPYSFKEDAAELIGELSNQAQILQVNPDVYPQVREQAERAYNMYNQIVAEDAKSSAPSVFPMTQEEFNNAIGFEMQETPAQLEEEVAVVDPKEEIILAKQKELGLPSTVEEAYVVSEPNLETILDVEEGIPTTIEKINSAVSELLKARRVWQKRRDASGREFTLTQIDDVIKAIETDLQSLATEKSYLEDPELRPIVTENNEQQGETSENASDESSDTEGDSSTSGESRPVKEQYTEAAKLSGVIESAEDAGTGVLEVAGRSIEAIEAALESGEDGDIARAIEETGRLVQSIGQSNDQAEAIADEVDTIVNEDAGDGDISQEPTEENEQVEQAETETESGNSDADNTTVKEVKRKGVPKSQRKIKDADRLRALAKFPNNIQEEIYQFFVSNKQLETESVNRFFGKDKSGVGKSNKERQSMIASTTSAAKGGMTLDEAAHYLWENTNFGERFETSDYKNALEEVVQNYPGIKELTARLNAEPVEDIDTEGTSSLPEPEVVPTEGINEESALPEQLPDPETIAAPFSTDNNSSPISDQETKSVLGRLAKAFPNITVNIPATISEYVDALNQVTDPRAIYTADNSPYGFINPQDGAIYLDPTRLNTNTAIHEYGHIWSMWAKTNNPELYQKGIALVKDSNYFRNIANNPSYASLSREQMLDEALSTAIGNKGDNYRLSGRKNTFREWLSDVFKGVKDFLGIKSTPQQIQDMSLKDFTAKVVSDLTSGNQISGISSAQIAEIMADQNADMQEVVQTQGSDPLLHATPATFGAPGSGEHAGTLAQLKDKAIAELQTTGIYEKTAQKLTKSDKNEINAIASRYGWTFKGKEMVEDPATGIKMPHYKFSNDISTHKNSMFLVGGKMVTMQLMGKSGKAGRVASAIYETDKWMNDLEESGSLGYKTMKLLMDSNFDGLNNIETLVKLIDSSDGILHETIHKIKRESSNNRNDAMNIMSRSYEAVRRNMGKLSTHAGMNSLDEVEKIKIKPLQWDRASGSAKKVTLNVPVAVAMNLVASHESQLSMGDSYNTREVDMGAAGKRIENHTSLVIDSHYATDPTDASLFFKEDKDGIQSVHKGFHFKREVGLVEKNGKWVVPKDIKQYGVFEQSEMDKLVDYFNVSGPKEVRETYQKMKQSFNDAAIREKLRLENDEAINPAEPFQIVKDYSPIQTVNSVSAQDKVNSFAPNLEDAKQLNVRTNRPDAIFAEDILDSYKYYQESVGHILGSTKLVHNLKTLQQAIISDYDGELGTRLNEILGSTVKNLQNFRQSQWQVSKYEKVLRPLLSLMGKYTAFTFRGNLGISTKQVGTYFSAMGLGYIDNKYLYQSDALAKTLWMSFRGSTTDRFAKGTIIEETGEGLKTSLGYKTAEADMIKELTGENISDPVKRAEHRKVWATVIQRAIYGSSQYTEAADLNKIKLSKNGKAKLKQSLSKYDEFWEERGMSTIRKLDRAVILGYMAAAKNQVTDEIKSGKTKPADANKRAAELTTETLYLTNQMNDPADLTMMQRNPTFASRVISVYSGQTQKLWNQMAGATIEYYKRRDSAPAGEVAILKKRMQYSLISNLVVNTLWMAGVNAGASVMRGFISGGDDKEDWYYSKKAAFDVARYVTGVAPGLSSNIMNYLISMVDNEKWEDEIFDIPGSDLIKNGFDFAKDMYGIGVDAIWEEKSEKETDKLYTGAIYNFSKLFGVKTGTPKIFLDPMAKQINALIKPPKNLKEDDIQIAEDAPVMDDEEEDDYEGVQMN